MGKCSKSVQSFFLRFSFPEIVGIMLESLGNVSSMYGDGLQKKLDQKFLIFSWNFLNFWKTRWKFWQNFHYLPNCGPLKNITDFGLEKWEKIRLKSMKLLQTIPIDRTHQYYKSWKYGTDWSSLTWQTALNYYFHYWSFYLSALCSKGFSGRTQSEYHFKNHIWVSLVH